MSKLIKDEFLAECLNQNYIKESTTSAELAQFAPLILPLVQKIYPQSLVNQIASIQPTKSPLAKISALYSIYTGLGSNNENNLHIDGNLPTWANSKIITVPASAVLTVGASGTSSSNQVTVFYKEVASGGPIGTTISTSALSPLMHVLVRVDAGDVVAGDVFTFAGTAGVNVLYASSNRNIIKRVFKDYSVNIEGNSQINEVNFEIRTSTIECKTRRIKSSFTQEKYQDILALYKEKTSDLVSSYVANEIQQEIDREVIQFLKDIATPMPNDIDLTKSFANAQSGSIGDMTYDLYFTIFAAIEEIVKATKRNRTMFILADSATVALLVSNALHSDAAPDQSNPYHVGAIGKYPLFCDPYSNEHYILIGYRYESDAKDDAGLIFTPYMSTIVETTDPETMQQKFATFNRYGYARHPQDAGSGVGDSDFFRYVRVNFGTALTIGPTGGGNIATQVRTTY